MNAEKTPLLTIHVSVFNLDKYIEQCLDSILTQDFDDYELILVDNGSTDRSIEICEGYVKRYSDKIKYKKFPLPTRIGRPYIYALSKMQGKYFMTVDGDDYITAGSLKKITEIIKAEHPDVIMGTFISDVEEGCAALRDARFDQKRLNGVSHSEVLKYLATVPNFHTVQWRFIVLKEILNAIFEDNEFDRTYDELLNESTYCDVVNMLRILSRANTMAYMEEPFYVYRIRTSSLRAMADENKQSIGLLAGLIAIEGWLEKDKREYVRVFVQSQVQKYFNLFINACTTATEAGYIRMAELINIYKKDFLKLREYQIIPLTEFCDLVDRYGAPQGLMMFTRLQEANLLYQMKPLTDKDVYVFPTGICGESTFLLLKSWDIGVKGFLDNDLTKEALLFQNYPCMLPERLKSLSEDKKQNIVAVIATSYEYLIQILRKQLISLGIPDNQIIIRR